MLPLQQGLGATLSLFARAAPNLQNDLSTLACLERKRPQMGCLPFAPTKQTPRTFDFGLPFPTILGAPIFLGLALGFFS